ncbi:MAG TPA: M56 family metallopeptidase [Gemmatimonadaceae bacterium]|nr:M56 family metallopeptidase [Gemmatimonadaceae bacterium]
MMLQWMAYAALCAALFGAAALCIERVFAGGRRGRRGIWMTTMLISIVVPAALPFAVTPSVARSLVSADASAQSPFEKVSSARAPQIDGVVLTAWATASLLFAGLLLVVHWRTRRSLRACHAETIAGRSAFISQDFGPAVVGILRHRIVVPAWVLSLGDGEQQFILMHELEHVRSRDPLLALVGVCAVVLMPWNAALWWQLARLRLAIEVDCDARVVARKCGDVVAYGQLLLCVRERGHANRHSALALSHSRSSLAKRLDALLERRANRPARVLGLATLAMGVVASVAFIPAPQVQTVLGELRDISATSRVAVSARGPAVNGVMEPIPSARGAAVSAVVAPSRMIVRRPVSRMSSRPSNATVASLADASLPPVSVVQSNPLGLAGPAAAPRIVVPRGAVMLRAGPSAAARTGGRGGFRAVAGGSVADSGRGGVVRAVGRASAGSPPDTTSRGFARGVGAARAVVRPDTGQRLR